MYFTPPRELDWQKGGKCYGDDPKKWDVESLNPLWPEQEAERLCAGCPVAFQCYWDAADSFSNAKYAGFPGEADSELNTEGVVRAGSVW